MARFIGIPLVRLLFRLQIVGRENIPAAGSYVLIANHLNWLDSFVILLAFPPEPRVHFMADPELLRRRRLQWWMVRATAGYIAVDRHEHPDTAMFERVLRCLRLGAVVAIYPEGNYGSEEGRLLRFKKGFAHFATEAQVPVVPVALSGTKELWLRKAIHVAIGPPIETSGHEVDPLVDEAETALARLLPRYKRPPGPKLLRQRLTHLF